MSTTRLYDVLQGSEANYILPFLWQHGEDETVLREEMARVNESGIRAVCVEARPHPDFYGPRWWRDIDIIMEEARTRGMRVWLLDDDHFPTGHAAGKNANAPAALRRLFLKEHHIDAIGPQNGASFPIKPWSLDFMRPAAPDSTLVAAVAARRDPTSAALMGEFIDVTACVRDDVLYWDIPSGYWRIFLLFTTHSGGSDGQRDYINPIVPESVRVLIDAVYEPFYEHYRADFGATFAGFFSDEPGFYNDRQVFDYQSKLGKKGVDLPWRADMLDRLGAACGQDFRTLLPLLWHDGGALTGVARYTYMDVVSKLYGECFTQQIGDWCRAHGVDYIGHILEDNGVHTRLGPSAGHFFRALWGQDMAGLDVVLWQLVPGYDQGPFAGVAGELDGEFFHYGLAKLGSSLAHIDPKKQGRAMCEVFGAYGWREGLKMMKWMTDHMLVRGINYFVPHAFSQAEFPDPDCPPHLYARGKNPQYRYYCELNHYTNRVSHLLSGGRHIASAAVLYHAEAEWSAADDAAWMPFHKPVRVLMQQQIDCDVLPGDVLLGAAAVAGGKLMVNAESYECLIVPFCVSLPAALLSRLAELAEQGLPVLFVDGLPERSSEGTDAAAALERLSAHGLVCSVSLGDLAQQVKEMGFYEIAAADEQPSLRHYHVTYPDMEVYMFFNEHPLCDLQTTIRVPANGRAVLYDALSNRIAEAGGVEKDDGLHLSLHLSPYESIFVLTGPGVQDIPADSPRETATHALAIAGPWSVAMATSEQYPSFTPIGEAKTLSDMSRPGALPNFSGTFRYEAGFEWSGPDGAVTLDLGEVFETAQAWVNGWPAGVLICPPYRFAVGELLQPGHNTLVVEVTNTLVKEQRDFFSRFAPQEPSGLLGPVQLVY